MFAVTTTFEPVLTTVFSSSVIVFATVKPSSKLVLDPVKNVFPVKVSQAEVFAVSIVDIDALVLPSVSISPD